MVIALPIRIFIDNFNSFWKRKYLHRRVRFDLNGKGQSGCSQPNSSPTLAVEGWASSNGPTQIVRNDVNMVIIKYTVYIYICTHNCIITQGLKQGPSSIKICILVRIICEHQWTCGFRVLWVPGVHFPRLIIQCCWSVSSVIHSRITLWFQFKGWQSCLSWWYKSE